MCAIITKTFSLFFQTSTDSLSEEDVKLYTTAHHIALQRHYTTTIGWGTELEIFPWFGSLCVLLFLQPSC